MNEVIRVKEVIIEKEVISCDVSPVAMFNKLCVCSIDGQSNLHLKDIIY